MENKRLISVFLVLIAVACRVYGQTDELMDRAVKEYLRGDYLGAIQDFDRVLEMEENEKAGQLLYKSLVEEGKRRLTNKQYEEAKKYLSRALDMKPDDPEVEDLIDQADRKLGVKPKQPEPEENKVKELRQRIAAEQREKNTYLNRLNSITVQRNSLKSELQENENKLKSAQATIEELEGRISKGSSTFRVIGGISGLAFLLVGVLMIITLRNVYYSSGESRYQLEELESKISQRLKEAEEDSEELEEKVARSINQMIDGQKDVAKQISSSAAGKTQTDIEEIKEKLDSYFEQQQNRLIDLLNQQAKAISSESTEKVELPGGRVITDINPQVRARADGVEMIPRTITDPSVAEKMLKPYLSDPNNRVRGNACVAIHQYNRQLAVDTLDKMAQSPDKWMRLTAAWAVGEIATSEVVPILRKLLDDIDERVRDRAMRAFENMAEIKEDVSEEIRKMIDRQKENPQD